MGGFRRTNAHGADERYMREVAGVSGAVEVFFWLYLSTLWRLELRVATQDRPICFFAPFKRLSPRPSRWLARWIESLIRAASSKRIDLLQRTDTTRLRLREWDRDSGTETGRERLGATLRGCLDARVMRSRYL